MVIFKTLTDLGLHFSKHLTVFKFHHPKLEISFALLKSVINVPFEEDGSKKRFTKTLNHEFEWHLASSPNDISLMPNSKLT